MLTCTTPAALIAPKIVCVFARVDFVSTIAFFPAGAYPYVRRRLILKADSSINTQFMTKSMSVANHFFVHSRRFWIISGELRASGCNETFLNVSLQSLVMKSCTAVLWIDKSSKCVTKAFNTSSTRLVGASSIKFMTNVLCSSPRIGEGGGRVPHHSIQSARFSWSFWSNVVPIFQERCESFQPQLLCKVFLCGNQR